MSGFQNFRFQSLIKLKKNRISLRVADTLFAGKGTKNKHTKTESTLILFHKKKNLKKKILNHSVLKKEDWHNIQINLAL